MQQRLSRTRVSSSADSSACGNQIQNLISPADRRQNGINTPHQRFWRAKGEGDQLSICTAIKAAALWFIACFEDYRPDTSPPPKLWPI